MMVGTPPGRHRNAGRRLAQTAPLALGLLCALLSACASSPTRKSEPVATQAAPITLPSIAELEHVPVHLDEENSSAMQALRGDQYTDLLERMRAGFALGDADERAVDQEADWFARNPQYIERVFTRAAPYLHYIVNEVEARGLPLELALLPIIESAFQPYA